MKAWGQATDNSLSKKINYYNAHLGLQHTYKSWCCESSFPELTFNKYWVTIHYISTKMLTFSLENIQNCVFQISKITLNSQFYISSPISSEEKDPFNTKLDNKANETTSVQWNICKGLQLAELTCPHPLLANTDFPWDCC